jgi:transposase
MKPIVIHLRNRVRKRLREIRRTTHDRGLAMRCQMVLQAAKGRLLQEIADALGCSRSWVSRVLGRFQAEGEAGLLDRREDNGQQKLDEWYLGQLHEVVAKRPPEYGYRRPTWTRELLVEVMARLTGQRVHMTAMSRVLATMGARRGRPRPVVRCLWSRPTKNRDCSIIVATLDFVTCQMMGVDSSDSVGCPLVPFHAQGNALAEVRGRADAVDASLGLAEAAVAAFDSVAGGRPTAGHPGRSGPFPGWA